MKKNLFALFVLVCLCVALVLSVSACAPSDSDTDTPNDNGTLKEFKGITFTDQTVDYDGNEHELKVSGSIPSEASVSYSNNKLTIPGTSNATATIKAKGYKDLTLNAEITVKPTGAAFVAAAKNTDDESKHEYDYKFNVSAQADILGYIGAVNGNYEANYRYDKANDSLQFKRTTSGALFYDSTKFIVNQGDQKITLTQNKDGEVKKVKVASADDETSLVNREFESLINSLTANEVKNLKNSTVSGYRYQFNIDASSDNAIADKLLKVIKNIGLNISIKNITITNPTSGVVVYFNLDADSLKLKDYKLGVEIKTPIKAVETAITLSYEQTRNTSSFNLPSTAGFIFTQSGIETELSKINSAFATLKNDNAYSLDLTAENEFDPGITTWATKDKYIARLYKNTDTEDNFVSFNKSYEYKTHHEEDGKETYKYTIGNTTEEGKVYMISRKGKNVTAELSDVTQDTLYEEMINHFVYTASQIDCIKKETIDGVTTYQIYLNKQSTVNVSDRICDLINSNEADGVIKVDNYFNDEDYEVVGADMTVTMNGNTLTEISIETNIKYNPTGGDYTDKNIKLTDILTLTINKNLDKAQKYDAPKKPDGTISNLSYIL